ncbi:hypothetical protein ACFCZ1_01505 [Streptomyces sp. NPDC056224]|uniref:hypothetical protein n=1 Tax=Streptomyces sp. NPDC056224 TaxID=3345750 RepID=UPI0035DC9C07
MTGHPLHRTVITAGEQGSGARLPAEDEPARRAVRAGPGVQGGVTELPSLTRWTRSPGEEPGGRTLPVERGEAGTEQAEQPRIVSTRHPAPGTRHPAPGTRHPAPGTRHPAPGTRHPAPPSTTC